MTFVILQHKNNNFGQSDLLILCVVLKYLQILTMGIKGEG